MESNQAVRKGVYVTIAAIHEAGHLIVAEALGIPHEGATIDPKRLSKNQGGCFMMRPSEMPKKVARDYAVMSYAGRESELYFFGKDYGGHSDDYECADRSVHWAIADKNGSAGFLQCSNLKKKLKYRAAALVRLHAEIIVKAAGILTTHLSVNATTTQALVSELDRRLSRDNVFLRQAFPKVDRARDGSAITRLELARVEATAAPDNTGHAKQP